MKKIRFGELQISDQFTYSGMQLKKVGDLNAVKCDDKSSVFYFTPGTLVSIAEDPEKPTSSNISDKDFIKALTILDAVRQHRNKQITKLSDFE